MPPRLRRRRIAWNFDGGCRSWALYRLPIYKKVAVRKLFQLYAAKSLHDLRAPGNSLEALKGNRARQHSIRINDRCRLCFVWENGDAYQVEIVDYH
jgi:proteic killer suppression protein